MLNSLWLQEILSLVTLLVLLLLSHYWWDNDTYKASDFTWSQQLDHRSFIIVSSTETSNKRLIKVLTNAGITLNILLPFRVWMTVTQFTWPCLLSSFGHVILALPTQPPLGACLPAKQTLTVSHFLCQKAKSVPSGLTSPIRQPASPLSYVPMLVSHFGRSNGRDTIEGKFAMKRNWGSLLMRTDNWWRRTSPGPFPDRWLWVGMSVCRQGTNHLGVHFHTQFSFPFCSFCLVLYLRKSCGFIFLIIR